MANVVQEERFPGHPLLPYLLILPSVAVIVVFLVYPFLQSVQESFFASTVFGTKSVYVGLRNYERLFASPDFRNSALATLMFAAFVMLVGLSVSLAVAHLLVATKMMPARGFHSPPCPQRAGRDDSFHHTGINQTAGDQAHLRHGPRA